MTVTVAFKMRSQLEKAGLLQYGSEEVVVATGCFKVLHQREEQTVGL